MEKFFWKQKFDFFEFSQIKIKIMVKNQNLLVILIIFSL